MLVSCGVLLCAGEGPNPPGGTFWNENLVDVPVRLESFLPLILEASQVSPEQGRAAMGPFLERTDMPLFLLISTRGRWRPDVGQRFARQCASLDSVRCIQLLVATSDSLSQLERLVHTTSEIVTLALERALDHELSLGPFQITRDGQAGLQGFFVFDCWGNLVWASSAARYEGATAQTVLRTLKSSCANRLQQGIRAPEISLASPSSSAGSALSRLHGAVVGINDPSSRIPFRDSHAGQKGREGTPLLLVFWATWCAPCIAEIPLLYEIQEALGPEVLLVGISKDSGRNPSVIAQSFRTIRQQVDIARWGLHYLEPGSALEEVLFPEETQGGQAIPLPAFALLDHQGNLAYRSLGALGTAPNRAELEVAITRVRRMR